MVDDAAAWMVIGLVAGAFGVRGEMKVEALTDFPERFDALERVYLGPRHAPRAVEGRRFHNGRLLLKLEGIDTPEAVDSLRGQELYVPREQAVDLPEGHFFLEDALGMTASVTDGRVLGKVTDILRTGSNEVFVIGDGKTLIPSVTDAIAELDLEGRRLVVHPWVVEPPV